MVSPTPSGTEVRTEQNTAFVAGTAKRAFGDLRRLVQAVQVWRQHRVQPRWWAEASILQSQRRGARKDLQQPTTPAPIPSAVDPHTVERVWSIAFR
jgi:hypothetical protein